MKNYYSTFLRLSYAIRRKRLAENVSIKDLISNFLSGNSLSATSNQRNYYIIGNANQRYLFFKLIPLAFYNNGSLYVNTNFNTDLVIKELVSDTVKFLGNRVNYVSTYTLLEDLQYLDESSLFLLKSVLDSDKYNDSFPELSKALLEKITQESNFDVDDFDIRLSVSLKDVSKVQEDYLSGDYYKEKLDSFKKEMGSYPNYIISSNELSVFNDLHSLDFFKDIYSFIQEERIESYYDIALFLLKNNKINKSFSYNSLYKEAKTFLDSFYDESSYSNVLIGLFKKLSSSSSTLVNSKFLQTLIDYSTKNNINNIFTQLLVEKNIRLLTEVVGKDKRNPGILSNPSESKNYLDRLNAWKNNFFKYVRTNVLSFLSKDSSKPLYVTFSSEVASVTRQLNEIMEKSLQNVFSDQSIVSSLKKISSKTNSLYGRLLRYGGNVDKESRVFDPNNLFYKEVFDFIKMTAKNNLVEDPFVNQITKEKPKTGFRSMAQDIALFNSYAETVNNPDVSTKIKEGYIWSGIDLNESGATFVGDNVGTVEIPLGFTGYFSTAQRRDTMGQGEILKVDFDGPFMRLSTKSFYVKLKGQFDDVILRKIKDEEIMWNRQDSASSQALTSNSVASEIKGDVSRDSKDLNKYLDDVRTRFVFSANGDVVGMEMYSGREYFKKQNLINRGLKLKQIETLIEKIRSGEVPVRSKQDSKDNSKGLSQSYVLRDIENARSALDKYITNLSNLLTDLVRKNAQAGKYSSIDEMREKIIEASKNSISEKVIIVIELGVGDLFQFTTHTIYPLFDYNKYFSDGGEEFIKSNPQTYFRRVTPDPVFVRVNEMKGLDSAGNEAIKLFKENSLLYQNVVKEMNKSMSEAQIELSLSETSDTFLPLSSAGQMLSEFPAVLNRADDYLGTTPTRKVPLVFIGEDLEVEEYESGDLSHRIFESDYFSDVYKKSYKKDFSDLVNNLKDIYELNKKLIELMQLKILPSENYSNPKENINKFKNKIASEISKTFGLDLSKNISKALISGLVSFEEFFNNKEMLLNNLEKEGKSIDKSIIDSIESEMNNNISSLFNNIHESVLNSFMNKRLIENEDSPVEDLSIFQDFQSIASAIRNKSLIVSRILFKYKNEKSVLFEMIRSGRVMNYLLTTQIQKKRNEQYPEVEDGQI